MIIILPTVLPPLYIHIHSGGGSKIGFASPEQALYSMCHTKSRRIISQIIKRLCWSGNNEERVRNAHCICEKTVRQSFLLHAENNKYIRLQRYHYVTIMVLLRRTHDIFGQRAIQNFVCTLTPCKESSANSIHLECKNSHYLSGKKKISKIVSCKTTDTDEQFSLSLFHSLSLFLSLPLCDRKNIHIRSTMLGKKGTRHLKVVPA